MSRNSDDESVPQRDLGVVNSPRRPVLFFLLLLQRTPPVSGLALNSAWGSRMVWLAIDLLHAHFFDDVIEGCIVKFLALYTEL